MTSPLYCNPCFVLLGTSELPEDAARLEQMLGFRGMGSPLLHAQGVCARCGKEGDVVYHEAAT